MTEIKSHALFHGPNPYANAGVIVASLRIDELLAAKAQSLSGRFRALFPAWFDAPFQESSVPVVLLGQTASHWALRALNEIRGCVHEAGAREAPEGAHIWVGFHEPAVSAAALQLALKILLNMDSPALSRRTIEREVSELLNNCRGRHPDFQTQILMRGARATGVPYRPVIRLARCWQYGWGSRSTIFKECAPLDNGGRRMTTDKDLGKEVFRAVGAPTPPHRVVGTKDDLTKAAAAFGWPCVVKPTSENKGTGVTADIRSMEAMEAAFELASQSTDGRVMVEPHVPGFDHRILVANGRFFGTARRQPSTLLGDGRRSVSELLNALNESRSGNLTKTGYLKQVKMDDALQQHLAGQGFSLDSVLPAGTKVTLRSNANISTGGFSTDVTKETHPDTRRMAELIVETMGLVTAGLDYITEDIRKSPFETGAFIEINGNSGMDVLMACGHDAVEIGKAVLGSRPGRIPVTLVVVPDAELAEAQRLLRTGQWSRNTAWACGGLAGIGKTPLRVTGIPPWPAVDIVLTVRATERVWIVCGEQEILRSGLPVDGAERIVVGGAGLPAEWDAVFAANAERVERPQRWQAVIEMGDTLPVPKAS
jgi:D-alanine-D-alanine ligase-like ATP-grasp enzyme